MFIQKPPKTSPVHFIKLNANFIKDFQLHVSNFLNGIEPFWNWRNGIDEH